jgi:hypothetical protein
MPMAFDTATRELAGEAHVGDMEQWSNGLATGQHWSMCTPTSGPQRPCWAAGSKADILPPSGGIPIAGFRQRPQIGVFNPRLGTPETQEGPILCLHCANLPVVLLHSPKATGVRDRNGRELLISRLAQNCAFPTQHNKGDPKRHKLGRERHRKGAHAHCPLPETPSRTHLGTARRRMKEAP